MKSLNEYIDMYIMLSDENDVSYGSIVESSPAVSKIKPLGYIDDFNYNDTKFEEHRKTLLNCICITTPIEDNKDSNGDVEFRYAYSPNGILYKCKFVNKGKTNSLLKEPKMLSREKITDSQERVYDIVFGTRYKDNEFSTLEKLVNFICSKEYKHSNKEHIKYIFDQFITSCNEQKLKTYGLKTYLNQKLQTII